MYLTAQMDWFSRYVISWELDQTLEIDFVLACLRQALAKARPDIANSDRGSHYTSSQYTNLLLERLTIKISMDGRGRAMATLIHYGADIYELSVSGASCGLVRSSRWM